MGESVNQGSERHKNSRQGKSNHGGGRGRPGAQGRGKGRDEAKAAPLPALGQVVRQIEVDRQKLAEGPNAVRDFWRAQDAAHGKRPDYQLWRQLRGAERFTGRLDGVVQLMGQALRSQDVEVRWAALALLSSVSEEARVKLASEVASALKSPAPKGCEKSVAWVRWLAGEPLDALAKLTSEQERASWKPGRALAFQAVAAESWLPVSGAVFRCWVAGRIEQLQPPAPWWVTAWLLRRDARTQGAPRRAREANTLLDAAYASLRDGQPMDAVRYGGLALHLLPRTRPDWLWKRVQPMAWRLAEAGLGLDQELAVDLEHMPYPGEPPLSEKGREVAAAFVDEADVSRPGLMQEVGQEGDWEVLRASGAALQHPLPALAWVAKKAGSHAVKKQHALLEAAARLALKHGCWGSAGRILAVWPGSAAMVLAYAQELRMGLRRMPHFRCPKAWQERMEHLREAWGRLEDAALADEESIFLLHETLVDRLETTRRCLPEELRGAQLEAVAKFDVVADALEADARLLNLLEHQRVVELWEVAALARERADLEDVIWVSVVRRGAVASGRYSAMVLGRKGRKVWQGRTREGLQPEVVLQEIKTALREVSAEPPTRCLFAVDASFPEMAWETECPEVARWSVRSWEAAFRTLREGTLADLR